MAKSNGPPPATPYTIPKEGSLGLLALGYRGLVAWRAERGTDWIAERKAEYEAALARQEEQRSQSESGKAAARTPPSLVAPGDLSAVSVVVVTGLPRSGTSMLMQMLVAGGLPAFTDREREADASNPRGYFEHERIKALAHDKGWLPEADGHAAKVVAPLLPHLPQGPHYRVIFLERDLDEVLASQAAMLDRLGKPSADPALLRPVYERHLAAAQRWLQTTPRAESLVLAHRDLIERPAAQAAALNAF